VFKQKYYQVSKILLKNRENENDNETEIKIYIINYCFDLWINMNIIDSKDAPMINEANEQNEKH
jgi:hypothetical protein